MRAQDDKRFKSSFAQLFAVELGSISMGLRNFCFRKVDPLGSLYDPNMTFCVLSSVFVSDCCFWVCLNYGSAHFQCC